MTKKQVGRKPRYDQWNQGEGLLKVEAWARDGLTDLQICQNMGISQTTFYEWRNRFPKFKDTLKRGKEVVDIQVENALLKRALGYEYEEYKTIIDDAGNKKKQRIEKTTKTVAPDTTAQIFWLKNRKRNEWRDRQDIDQTSRVITVDVGEWDNDDNDE